MGRTGAALDGKNRDELVDTHANVALKLEYCLAWSNSRCVRIKTRLVFVESKRESSPAPAWHCSWQWWRHSG